MSKLNMGFSPSKEDMELFDLPSELSVCIAEYLRIGNSRGFSYPHLLNVYMGARQSKTILKIARNFESAHAYLLIGAQIRIHEEGGGNA